VSGDGEDYSDDEVDELYDELADALGEYGGRGGGDVARITVTARIEWAGEYVNSRGGVRTVHLDPMNVRPVREAMAKAQRLEVLAARGPLSSYKAKGWSAQLKQLSKTERGREALREAGFAPSRETLRRYGHGSQSPGRANREKIAQAYGDARNPGRGWAKARRDVADALTGVMKAQYGGSNIRFRDIEELRFE
jgi:hypothetical protein